MTTANRDDFWKLKKRKIKTIPARGLFGDDVDEISIRSLNELERSQIQRSILDANDGKLLFTISDERPYVIAYSVCDADGNRLFTDAEVEDIKQMDGGAIGYIYDQIDELCQISPLKEEKRLEELEKNSIEIGEGVLQSA